MRIGNHDVKLQINNSNQLAKKTVKKSSGKKTSSTQPTGKVDAYAEVSTKTFGSYLGSKGTTQISYDVVEGLYRRTIMRRAIDKMAGDATRLGYIVTYTDFDGNPCEDAAQIGADIDRMMRRKVIKEAYRDRDVYGDAFIYKQVGTSVTGLSNVQDLYGINPRYINPISDNGVLTGWQYQSGAKGESVDLSLEEVIHIPRDPLTGALFGDSLFESTLQVLNLILNSQLNSAILLDRFALPLIHWLIDSKQDRRKTPLTEIVAFIKKLAKLEVGADLVTDSSITHEVVGANSKVIDFSPMLDKLDAYFFATAGVPGQILGMDSGNNNSVSRQLQTYYENIFDMQSSVADYLIEELYWPEMITAGIDDLAKIDIVFNKPMIEQESRIISWVKDAMALNLITPLEGRRALNYAGTPPQESNGLEWILGSQNTNDPEFDKKQNQQTPTGTNPKKGSQVGGGAPS